MKRTLFVIAAMLSLCTATVGRAQDPTKLFSIVDHLSFFLRAGQFSPRSNDLQLGSRDGRQSGMSGFGFEFFNYIADHDSTDQWMFGIGLGYSQQGGFQSSDSLFDFSGTLRELPTLSLYIERESKWNKDHSQYFYASTGLIRLQNGVAIDTDSSIVSVSAEAFSLGGGYGQSLATTVGTFFVQIGLHEQRFPSIEFKETSGVTTIRHGWPRSLNFSSLLLTVGITAELRGK